MYGRILWYQTQFGTHHWGTTAGSAGRLSNDKPPTTVDTGSKRIAQASGVPAGDSFPHRGTLFGTYRTYT
jgi:hypothetical protein